jgi:hypothetical protein
MRLSSFILLPFALVLAAPNPQPVAAPAPTAAPRIEDAVVQAAIPFHKRQLTVSIFGATAVVSNGVICGGLLFLTGCFGTPGTNTVKGTIGTNGATVTGSNFSLLISGTDTSDGSNPTDTSTVTATNAAAVPSSGPGRAALAAGVGALAMGLL